MFLPQVIWLTRVLKAWILKPNGVMVFAVSKLDDVAEAHEMVVLEVHDSYHLGVERTLFLAKQTDLNIGRKVRG